LGFPLLYRTKRLVELTDAGKVFLTEAKQVLAQVQEAKHAAQRAYRGELGRLVVGYISSSTYDLLPMMLRVYHERFPGVEVALRELTTREQVRALEKNTFRLGCSASRLAPQWSMSRSFAGNRLCACSPRSIPLPSVNRCRYPCWQRSRLCSRRAIAERATTRS
jgi:DNA-binding transcriptional LysR family regulator